MADQIPGHLVRHSSGRWRLVWRDAERTAHSFTGTNLELVLAYARENGITASMPPVHPAAPGVEPRPEPVDPEKIVPDGPTDMRFSG